MSLKNKYRIRDDYQACVVGYDSSIADLRRMGMTEAEADRWLIPVESDRRANEERRGAQ